MPRSGAPIAAPPSGQPSITPAALPALCAIAVLLRLIPVVFEPSLDWGDEVYQALEPAHRLVFGTGLVTWEFTAHIRSWLLPGALAILMAPARVLGAGPGVYLACIALACAVLAMVPVVGTYRWCNSVFGKWPALAGASVAAFAPELVYFGARTLAEVVAAHTLAAALFLSRKDGARRNWMLSGGILLGLSFCLRPQILPAALILLVWPGYGGRARLMAGGAAVVAAAGLLDWLTLGAPSASIWRYAIVNLGGASASFGVQPWTYYGLAEAAIWGAALPIPVALCLWGARSWALPSAASLAILIVHMAIGHKEHRFLYPALVLGAVQAGIGLAELTARMTRRSASGSDGRVVAMAAIGAWSALSTATWFGPGLSTLRHRAQDTLAAADYAATLPDLCGIGMGPGKDAWVPYGGYTHLYQPVPLFWPADQAAFTREQAGFNLLVSESHEPGYATLRCFGAICAARRAGTCAAMPPDSMPPRP